MSAWRREGLRDARGPPARGRGPRGAVVCEGPWSTGSGALASGRGVTVLADPAPGGSTERETTGIEALGSLGGGADTGPPGSSAAWPKATLGCDRGLSGGPSTTWPVALRPRPQPTAGGQVRAQGSGRAWPRPPPILGGPRLRPAQPRRAPRPAPRDPTHPAATPPQPARQRLVHELPEAVDESGHHGGLGLPHAVHGQPRGHRVQGHHLAPRDACRESRGRRSAGGR